MAVPDHRGARGSNAGDDYHELWTLYKALSLLNPATELKSVYVEGASEKDSEGKAADAWDGVDSAFYYGGSEPGDIKKVELVQFKYSGANPDASWTISNLTSKKSGRIESSIVGALAKSFSEMAQARPNLLETNCLAVRLVSNRPVSTEVLRALETTQVAGSVEEADREKLRIASGLSSSNFEIFSTLLDLSECGGDSRFEVERKILASISEWNESNPQSDMTVLMRHIRTAMFPEAKKEPITKESILATLGVSDARALFPCPADLKKNR